MSNRIITISREFGSGGHTVGKKVAERLGIPCYDNELIQKIAEQSGFVEELYQRRGRACAAEQLAGVRFYRMELEWSV